ncbi:hypothetical protein HU200_005198 [Digitaria exilis]|uniref:Uncharacterized protein n=1 Tax=Digitaria exilis TaxID=1010633 RepID=A0A835FQV8_9POAL|nr:hypothetical protein HU200_005198 [Digitaria exilis]
MNRVARVLLFQKADGMIYRSTPQLQHTLWTRTSCEGTYLSERVCVRIEQQQHHAGAPTTSPPPRLRVLDTDGLATDEPRDVSTIAPLIPPLPAGGGAVQATLLPGHMDRSLVPDPRGLYDTFFQATWRPTAADKLLATFTSKDDVQRVKDVVAAEATRRVGTDSMCAWMDRFREVAGAMSMLSEVGSPRFRVYEMDMGFGPPEKVDIVSVARTGALAVAESRRGEGGVEVGVPLPPDDMERFRKCFADGIAGQHARRAEMID